MWKRGPKEESLLGNYSTKWGKGDQKKKFIRQLQHQNVEKVTKGRKFIRQLQDQMGKRGPKEESLLGNYSTKMGKRGPKEESLLGNYSTKKKSYPKRLRRFKTQKQAN